MRIAIAGFMHESNTFSPNLTDRRAFEQQSLVLGEAMLEEWGDAAHEVGSFFRGVRRRGWTPVPILMAWATPAGHVTDDVYEYVLGELIERIQREKPDGLLLALHGAMVTESQLDADGETVRRLREALGPSFPIAVTLDFHGNISPRLIDNATVVVAYHTCPHVDQVECGATAERMLADTLEGRLRPRIAIAKPPMIVNIMAHDTSTEPLLPMMQRAAELEKGPIRSVSVMAGFAYADVPQMGPSVLVVTDDDIDLAQREADGLAERLWEAREALAKRLPDASKAVRLALESKDPPVVLVETGDNVGGGSAADGTHILVELLRQEASDAVVCLWAPQEVQQCIEAGIGNEVTLLAGGKVDDLHGPPVEVRGRVRVLHDGTYVESAVRHGGKRINHMGPTALVELPRRVSLVLTTLRHPPFSLGQITCLGIVPSQQRILVVKAAIAYKAAYLPVAGSILEVDTPGLTAVNPERFRYKHIRRPLYPLA